MLTLITFLWSIVCTNLIKNLWREEKYDSTELCQLGEIKQNTYMENFPWYSYYILIYFIFLQVLVLGNKRDLPNALDEKELIEKMNLSAIQDREICCYSISCKEKENIGMYTCIIMLSYSDLKVIHLPSELMIQLQCFKCHLFMMIFQNNELIVKLTIIFF